MSDLIQPVSNTIGDSDILEVLGVDLDLENLFGVPLETDDPGLDKLIQDAKRYFNMGTNTHVTTALNRISLALDKIKSLCTPDKSGTKADKTFSAKINPNQDYDFIIKEIQELRRIYNRFHVRHGEKDQIEIQDTQLKSWLFVRIYNFVNLCIKTAVAPGTKGSIKNKQ